jgi:hypothetical protein
MFGAGLLLATALALVGGAPVAARTQPQAQAAAPLAAPLAANVTIELCASAGSVTMPDTTVVPIWGFSPWNGSSCGPAQLPGPVLDVNAGDAVTVILHNQLAENVSIIFPGQSDPSLIPPDMAGAASGGTATYTFTANDPGTYLYESGVNAEHQVPMGLYGALIVRSGTPGQAYNAPLTAYDVEALLVLSEIDPAFNANPTAFNKVDYAPKYWLINGRAYPDTTTIGASANQRVLLRYVNAGLMNHTMTLLGMHQRVIAADAFAYPYPFDVVAQTIPSGQTSDMIALVPSSAADGNRFPVYNRQLHLDNAGAYAGDGGGGMLTFITISGPAGNVAPVVSAGADQAVTLPASANLAGTAFDPDNGPGALTTLWTQQSGPGTATIATPSALSTSVSFSAAGTYVLRLTASDGAATVFDDVTIVVDPAPTMHIGDLDNTSNNPPNPNWRPRAMVTVHTTAHGPVAGATVNGNWTYGATTSAVSCGPTNGAGQCQVQTPGNISDSIPSAAFTVTSVTTDTLSYNSAANHDPDGDSDGTTITVLRP